MMPRPEPYRLLVVTATVYLGGYLAHFADHIAFGLSRTPVAVLIGGTFGGIGGVLTLLLARARNPLAAPLAVATGLPAVAGFAAVHIPPYWGPFSEPFTNASPASWATVAFAMLGGLVIGVAGLYALRARARSIPTV